MNTKHTPGPWAAKPKGKLGEWHIDSAEWGIAIVAGGAGHEGFNGRSDENARLIAAAPELLEALKAVDRAWSSDWSKEDCSDVSLLIGAAIAKAEGRS